MHLGRIALLTIATLFALVLNAAAEGMLRYAGATTLQRFFMPEIVSNFSADTAIKVSVEGGNTGPGIRALLEGEIDMAGAGRFLTEDEKGRGLVEHFLGWDPLAVVVHQSNQVDNLTLSQLQGILSGEITDWQAVGGTPGPIVVVTCPQGSGMRSAAKKMVLREKEFLDREIVSAIVAEADQQVSMFATGITILSRSMVDASLVKMIQVDGVSLTDENVVRESYPLIKPLLLVTKGEPVGELARFMALVKSEHGKTVLKKNFVPAE